MSSDQVYYLTVALINLILAFAGTRIKPIKGHTSTTPFLIASFFSFATSWFLYSLSLTLFYRNYIHSIINSLCMGDDHI